MPVPSLPNIYTLPFSTSNTMEFNWSPGSDNGNAITSYYLTIPPDSRTFTIPPDWRYYTVNNLSAAVTYYPTLAASNSDGLGPSSNFRFFQCGNIPAFAPSTVSASLIGTTSSIVSWTPPLTLPNATVFWYYIESKSSKSTDPIIKVSANGLTQSNILITGLNSNSTYSFLTRPVNCPGYGPSTFSGVINTNPTSVSGLNFWIDAADSSSITLSSGNVSQINDKSGNNYNVTQATTGSQPSYVSSNIIFSNDKFLNIPQSAINNATSWSMFMVLNPISSSNWFFVKQHNGVNTYNVLSMTYNTSSGGGGQNGIQNYGYWRSLNAGSQTNTGTGLYIGRSQLWELIYDGTTMTMYRDGVSLRSTTGSFAIPNVTTATNFTLGAWIAGTTQNPGITNFRLGELAFYSNAVTSADRLLLETYFTSKWGITAFTPASISGLQVWLDGNDPLGTGTKPSNGATVSTWFDKSGNVNNATSGAATFIAGTPGYMNFGGSTAYNLTSGAFIVNNYFTFFIVERLQSSANQYPSLFGSQTYPTTTEVTIMNYQDTGLTGVNWVRATNNSISGLSSFTSAGAQPNRIWTLRFITNLQTMRLNGVQVYSFVTNTKQTNWLTPRIGGALNNAAFNYYGHMKEILMYTGELTDAQVYNIESYLMTKWGVFT